MLHFQRGINFPIDLLAAPRVPADQHDGAGSAGDMVLTNTPPHVIGIVAINAAFQRIVKDDFMRIVEMPRKRIVVSLIARVMIADKHSRPYG